MFRYVAIKLERYRFFKKCEKFIENLKSETPEYKITVYGFIGEHQKIFIMKSFKEFEKYMERYTEIQISKIEFSKMEDKYNDLIEKILALKKGFFFNLFYGKKL